MKCTSPLLENMSGKLGGSVAAKARGGIQYFRALVIPTNPDTSFQKASRNAMASAAALWRSTLTEAQQEAWWDAATGSLTGQGLFTKVNQPRIYANNADVVTLQDAAEPISYFPSPLAAGFAPTTTLTTPGSVVIDDSANTMTVTLINELDEWNAGTDTGAAGVLYVYASHQQNASRLSREHPFRMIGAFAFGVTADALAAPINLAPLGFTTQAGKVMYVKFRAQTGSGGISGDSTIRVTITA